MTTEELHELAAAGVSQRIHAIEQQLAKYHEGWPELFRSATPPQLLKIPMNGNGNGNGHQPAVAAPPAVATTKETAPAQSVFDAAPARRGRRKKPVVDGRTTSWTPERRAKHARAMRKAKRAANA
jgi:hypothetical protein